jgi:hypothetical protein
VVLLISVDVAAYVWSCGVCALGRRRCRHFFLVVTVTLLTMETLVDWFFEGPIIFPQCGIFYTSTTTSTMVRILAFHIRHIESDKSRNSGPSAFHS